jgi:serine/threonine-protein kinase
MGVVWSATDPQLGREVAVKVLARRHAGGPGVERRFLSEARITGQLDHPGIVPLHALLRTGDGLPAYAMKRVDGVTLHTWLQERGAALDAHQLDDRADLPGRLEVFLKIADAVHFAHVRGVVHRDLKPENVMVGRHGEVWVMDWGTATGPESEPSSLEGTPGFFAPEQANGAAPDPRQDQYSLGLVLQEVVTLRDAVQGRTALERALANSLGERVVPVLRSGARPPRELVAILTKATSLDPRHRYPEVAALAADLRRYLAGEPVQATPDSWIQGAARWVGRHREATLALGVGLAAAAGVALAAVEVRAARQREEARAHEAELAASVAAVADRAGHIDARLARDEGLLGELAAVAAERMHHGAGAGTAGVWFADLPETTPPTAAPSPAYRQVVDFRTAVFTTPDGSHPDTAGVLAPLARGFRAAALRSAGGPEVDPAGAASPPPIAWVSLGLTTGLSMSWPGHGDFPAGYDARLRPWYTVALGATGPVWGAPYVDSSGLGVLLPCSAPVREPDTGVLLGVASIKLPLDQLIGDLLAWEGASSYLLDSSGHTIVSSTDRGDLPELRDGALPMPLFDDQDVVSAAIGHRPLAHDAGGLLTVVHPLRTVGWAYVVRGPRDQW